MTVSPDRLGASRILGGGAGGGGGKEEGRRSSPGAGAEQRRSTMNVSKTDPKENGLSADALVDSSCPVGLRDPSILLVARRVPRLRWLRLTYTQSYTVICPL